MPVSEAKRRNNDKYNMKCDFIAIKPLRPIGEKIREKAKESGKSLQGYILDAIERQICEDEDGKEIPDAVITHSIEWLKAHGHSGADIVDFLKFGKE